MLRNSLLSVAILTVSFVIAACGSSSEPVEVQVATPGSAPGIPTAIATVAAVTQLPASNLPAPISTVAAVAQSPASNPPAPAAVVPTQPPIVEVKIGNSVGDHVPEFEFSFADGTKVSSASLIEQAEPAYLFFFATW